MVSPCSFSSFSFRSVPEKSALGWFTLLSIGDIGGADRTFACKSQECLWQDWYI